LIVLVIVSAILLELGLNIRESFIEKVLFFTAIIFAFSMFVSLLAGIVGIIHVIIKKKTTRGFSQAFGGIALVSLFILIALGPPALDAFKKNMYPYWNCRRNLRFLHRDIIEYSEQNESKYPSKERWCDELSNMSKYNDQFHCPAADPNYYENRRTISHYAINPNCEPNSPNDVVLLFDTKAGWNQHGGAELLSPENHEGKGCNILFNDGTVEFIKKKDFDKLRWK
jgi:hypothetical protein